MNLSQVTKLPGCGLAGKYFRQGMLRPTGFALTSGAGIRPYFSSVEIERFRKRLKKRREHSHRVRIEGLKALSDGDLALVARMRKQGKTFLQIALHFGVSSATVQKRLKRYRAVRMKH
jgi:hypothetical protein